jgi:hypothetical protein
VDDGGRRCGAVVVVVVVDELLLLLRENERGCVGGAVRVILVLPISLSSLSLEGGGEAVLLRRRKMPLPLVTGTSVELVVASGGGRAFLGDAARTISAFVDMLYSGSACPEDCTSHSLLAALL